MAREEYCCSWYKAAFAGRLQGIIIRLRDGDCDKNEVSLGREKSKPDAIENYLMEHHGTHHQKPILIDFAYKQGEKAVGYLLAVRKKVIAGWNRNCAKIGKDAEDIPFMHVFIVIPVPEVEQMIPRTYESLAPLGQQEGMTGQVEKIEKTNETFKLHQAASKQVFGDAVDRRASAPKPVPEVVSTANKTFKPTALILENTYGLRVCVAVLNACEFNKTRYKWRYREIYIHSKLLLVDDGFFTLGSANLNQRSMVADSEINLATNDPKHAIALRKRIWSQLATEKNNGGDATPKEIWETFDNWMTLMKKNKDRQKSKSPFAIDKKMDGFIVPLDDGRSSTIRVA